MTTRQPFKLLFVGALTLVGIQQAHSMPALPATIVEIDNQSNMAVQVWSDQSGQLVKPKESIKTNGAKFFAPTCGQCNGHDVSPAGEVCHYLTIWSSKDLYLHQNNPNGPIFLRMNPPFTGKVELAQDTIPHRKIRICDRGDELMAAGVFRLHYTTDDDSAAGILGMRYSTMEFSEFQPAERQQVDTVSMGQAIRGQPKAGHSYKIEISQNGLITFIEGK